MIRQSMLSFSALKEEARSFSFQMPNNFDAHFCTVQRLLWNNLQNESELWFDWKDIYNLNNEKVESINSSVN